ncbi:MAG: hypothetical protein ACLFWF_07680 [Alphaproteobacteria bacterium]
MLAACATAETAGRREEPAAQDLTVREYDYFDPLTANIRRRQAAGERFYEPGLFADGVDEAGFYGDAIGGQRFYPGGPKNEVSLLNIQRPPLPPIGEPPLGEPP